MFKSDTEKPSERKNNILGKQALNVIKNNAKYTQNEFPGIHRSAHQNVYDSLTDQGQQQCWQGIHCSVVDTKRITGSGSASFIGNWTHTWSVHPKHWNNTNI